MKEDYNFLKLKLSFLEALEKARGDIKDGTYCIGNFELYEKYNIEFDDIENLIKKTENGGILKIISENDLDNDFVEYPTKGYELSFDEKKFQKVLGGIRDKLSGEIKLHYDEPSSTLFINDEQVRFTGKLAGSNQADLCKVLLKDSESVNRRWFNDEVLEEWGYRDDDINKESTRKVYDAANELNKKIAKITNMAINEFFISKLHEVSVSPNYRSSIEYS